MGKYKVYVYAISKNEEKFVDRWYNSMKEADAIFVSDTGSSDETVKKLKEHGVNVQSINIDPFRFDEARNKSLEFVPLDADICVCTDLDEVFVSGWRENLESVWDNITRLRYNYNWSFDENNNPQINFYIEKIHNRLDYKWTHPVHEVLTYIGSDKEKTKTTDLITVNHYPDRNKSRSSYLPLLELSVKECPEDDRNLHYLGREYMYYKRYNDAIDTLIKHLNCKNATWKDERAASMRFIARCYKEMKRYKEAIMWAELSILEAPYLRDTYMELALIYFVQNDFLNTKYYLEKALFLPKKEKTYINEVFSNDYTIYDMLSICYYYLGKYNDALTMVNFALNIKNDDPRVINNKKLIEDKIK